MKTPHIIIIAGPNGAGKSTTAPVLLQGTLGVTEFVNADTIAAGLSAFKPEDAAIAAGRIMLERLKVLATERADFAFETTLASRTFAHLIDGLQKSGYCFHLVFLWLPSPEFAVARVAERVRIGGHGVPDETVRRRYHSGIRNFFTLYKPLSTSWRFYDNSNPSGPRLIAAGGKELQEVVNDPQTWNHLNGEYNG